MITLRKFIDYVAAEPFRPFRVRMASGKAFEIRHGEMISVSLSSVRIYTSLESDEGEREQWHKFSMTLINAIEPIEEPVGQKAN